MERVGGSLPTTKIVHDVLSAIFLAAVFRGWNTARNRRWWILVIAVVMAVVITGVDMLITTQPVAVLSPNGALGARIRTGDRYRIPLWLWSM